MLRRLIPFAVAAALALVLVSTAAAKVLLVGSYHGIHGKFNSIQAAVDSAKAGDWILIGPGDYKTTTSRAPHGGARFPAGIVITKPNLHLRGMNRNSVIVDGTKPGSVTCSRKPAAQNFGPRDRKGPEGLNGIMIWKANSVSVQNLTVCNFLGGSGGDGVTGNEVWWNGGAGSGTIGGWGFSGTYLSATSTFFKTEATAALYGIFSSNWSGGSWNQAYASNFNDSGFYIGACRQVCDQTINHVWAEYNALGYSGSNSGGRLVLENSQWDNNLDGININSQNGDNPPPQNGSCPNNGISPISHSHSCWVAINNYVHDNNNPNVPSANAAAAGPVGSGIVDAGGRNDTFLQNRIVNNAAWGLVLVAYPDQGKPCTGGTLNFPLLGPGGCLYDDWGNAVIGNTFGHNGAYGNPTNGDFAQLNLEPGHPTDCYRGNVELGGGSVTSSPANLQQTSPTCDGTLVPADTNSPFLGEVYCDSQLDLSLCLATDHYPRRTRVVMHPLPRRLPTMPNPCTGVPTNPWCSARGGR